MTQADNSINHRSTVSAILVITRAVELGVFWSPLGPDGAGYSPSGPYHSGHNQSPLAAVHCGSLHSPDADRERRRLGHSDSSGRHWSVGGRKLV